jgi:cellulose synthase/poly-beta-1,6-N-acetylglucosamine synthase-like glycosyltransferase
VLPFAVGVALGPLPITAGWSDLPVSNPSVYLLFVEPSPASVRSVAERTGGTTSHDPPFISVIVPTYARPRHLTRCLEALVRQDYPTGRVEVIVVDDGGPTPAPPVVDQLDGRLRVTVVRQPARGGRWWISTRFSLATAMPDLRSSPSSAASKDGSGSPRSTDEF